jgi:hypothetical protein
MFRLHAVLADKLLLGFANRRYAGYKLLLGIALLNPAYELVTFCMEPISVRLAHPIRPNLQLCVATNRINEDKC